MYLSASSLNKFDIHCTWYKLLRKKNHRLVSIKSVQFKFQEIETLSNTCKTKTFNVQNVHVEKNKHKSNEKKS